MAWASHGGLGSPSGAASASCPCCGHALPSATGGLQAGGGCSVCCNRPTPVLPGTSDPCADSDGSGGSHTQTRVVGLGGTTFSTAGPSPRTLEYTVLLTSLPSGARIFRAEAKYVCPVPNSVITDPGGQSIWPSQTVYWDDAGCAPLRGSQSSVPIRAVCSWSLPYSNSFWIERFTVHFTVPTRYPY